MITTTQAEAIFEAIKHGTKQHREWLREALLALANGQPVPKERETVMYAGAWCTVCGLSLGEEEHHCYGHRDAAS